MRYDYCARTDRGLQRANNEDAVAVDPAAGLAVLADGMGGYSAGEVASALAVQVICAQWPALLKLASSGGHDARQLLQQCADLANQAIWQAAHADPNCYGMGTTLVVGVLLEDRLLVGHVGDSRCYCWRDGQLHPLTRDHSLLQEQLSAGLISVEQAKTALHRNLVTRALGVEETVRMDVTEWPVQPGDTYLMCSDGLTEMIDHEGLTRLMAEPLTLELKAELLIQSANQAGGRDNISVILVQALPAQAAANSHSRLPMG